MKSKAGDVIPNKDDDVYKAYLFFAQKTQNVEPLLCWPFHC